MFQRLKKLFFPDPRIQNYSTTLTAATQGAQSKKTLSPKVKDVLDRLDKTGKIDHEGLNDLCAFYLNVPPVPNGYFHLNQTLFSSMCLIICGVSLVHDDQGDVQDVQVKLKDVVYETEMTINVPARHFHEFFTTFQPSFMGP